MNRYIMFHHIFDRMKWVVASSLVLIWTSCLMAAEVKRVSPDEALRATIFRAKPEYTGMARQLKLGGSVSLDVDIAEDGTVENISVVKGNPILAKSATEAMKQWKFSPFKSEGKAIKVVAEIAIEFHYSQ